MRNDLPGTACAMDPKSVSQAGLGHRTRPVTLTWRLGDGEHPGRSPSRRSPVATRAAAGTAPVTASRGNAHRPHRGAWAPTPLHRARPEPDGPAWSSRARVHFGSPLFGAEGSPRSTNAADRATPARKGRPEFKPR